MLKILIILTLLISSVSIYAQLPFDASPKQTPDTLYFDYKDDIQLIIINNHDTYRRYGAWYDGMYPRGGSWFMDNGPAPKNVYIFRDKDGKIIKTFNSESIDESSLESTTYINTDELSLNSILDYVTFNGHLMFYGKNDEVGLINLKGKIVVPAIYDAIRNFKFSDENINKLIVFKDNKFGFLDSNLRELFPPIYQAKKDTLYVGYPEHNVIDNNKNIKVFKEDKCGLISVEGEVLVDFLFDDIRIIHDDMYMGLIYRGKNEITHSIRGHWNWGYQVKTCIIYDKDFNVITKLEDFEYIYYYGIKRFIVKKDNKFGVLNHLGEIVVPLEYDMLTGKSGVYYVTKNSKMGLISLDGKIVLPIEYERIDGVFVTQNGLIGVCNRQFELIAKPQFVNKNWDMGKYILKRKDGSIGFVKNKKKDSYYQSPEGEVIKL